jgi:phosphohistidine phosphatase
MELILWRHADAEMTSPDISRALTPKGRLQAQKVGAWLASKLPDNCKILVSPAVRAVQTAEAIGREFTIVEELGPGASAEMIMYIAKWPKSKEPVLIVGHQPSLGMVASPFIGSRYDVNIDKANVWWLAQKGQGDFDMPYLKCMMSPDLA